MPAEIPKCSNAHFRNIPEYLSPIFDANLTQFLPEGKIYVSTEKIMEKLSEFLAEIPGGGRAQKSRFFYNSIVKSLNSKNIGPGTERKKLYMNKS